MNKYYRNKNVFISGGAGVIGRVLVEKLHQEGANLFVGDLKTRPEGWGKEIRYRQGDLNEVSKEELLDFRPEIFFHLAATFERSEETFEFWEENFHHNVKLSHHLIDCLKVCEALKRVVFASSYLIYDPKSYLFPKPKPHPVRLSEKDPIEPRNLCGMAKLLHEKELTFIQQFRGDFFSSVSARIFRSYGRGSRDVISRWISALMDNEEITVFGKEAMFDFIFADDAAYGLQLLGKSDFSGIVNLGSGHARKIKDVLDVLKTHFPNMKMLEKELTVPYESSEAEMSRFQKLTGWVPETTIESGIFNIIDSL